MPDAARLVAAICIGLLGYIVSLQIIPLMPESTDFGYFVYVNAVIGVFVGWTVMGKRAGRGLAAAVNNGFGGALMLVLWGLFIHSCVQMFDRAMANWYNGAFQALLAIVKFMAEYGLVMINPLVIFTLIAGGLLAGLFTEFAWRTWR
ncbi:TrgA family protein [Roseobacter sinensis]|uniref:TrgA family protein n=1 Tax=Roseobacter sinensis TaxID=2931391 RepID=A0ABT3BEM9_9RHOB|nr:TrgA family protein [Roseobacter sp. WL0113]MCV3272007.1 TrgA family protein [Roseobacter sp. WL0113]